MLSGEKAIELKSLSKSYNGFSAVNNLDLTVYRGDVFGFLGPNGAGKSTTIRMLLTLIQPTSGEIFILGKSLSKYREEILRKTGSIVEKPDFYPYLSAFKNLEILAKLSGAQAGKNKIMEMLDLVSLKDRAQSRVKTFSHGMKQRLGIAQALLHDPELVILDEPTTGLDPQGMKDIRELITRMSSDMNKTVFLSSHLLNEVELVANRMAILNKGTKVVEGEVEKLFGTDDMKVEFEVDDENKAKQFLQESAFQKKVISFSENSIHLSLSKDEIPLVNKMLVSGGVNVKSIVPVRSLEELFLKLT